MSDQDATARIPEEPDPDLVEAIAKQLFRAESPPDLLWDTRLFEEAGRSTEGLKVASDDVKDEFRRRAHETLIDRQG